MTEREQSLRDALRDAAGMDDDPSLTTAENWQQLTRWALAQAEIEATDEQLARAWRVAWQRAFSGGSYTLDARAILAVIDETDHRSE